MACTLGTAGTTAHAALAAYCNEPAPLSAAQNDRLIRFGAIVKAELERSGASVALIARSGLDLSRFGQRYSHAGVSLKAGPESPWAVRQLYFDCDERRPRLFDQGMAAFVLGGDEPTLGYVSVLLLPPAPAAALERTALDNRQALALLGREYSANAYPFSPRYQNCNQWVAELLAIAWGTGGGMGDGTGGEPGHATAGASGQRERAQAWLSGEGYEATVFDVGWRALMWAGNLIPWVHGDDHPAEDTEQQIYRVSMPASIEAFVRRRLPGTTRMEFCHTETQVVIRRGWKPIADGCRAGAQDTVITLE
ncbi:MAG: DUF2145 domain-containing protein [Rubrivivax sp.]|nr:DUF2145 domain-containing protein [Rubrivivax sp.]